MNSKFQQIFNQIFKQQKLAFNCIYEQITYNNNSILPLSEDEVIKAFQHAVYFNDNNNIINETDHQKYYVQLPQRLQTVVNENINKDIKDEVMLSIFPELQLIPNRPHIFCGIFSFSDKENTTAFLQSISKISTPGALLIFKTILNKETNGICIDLRLINKKLNLIFILFNSDNFTRRTIYHEFTHYLQCVVGQKYKQILTANIQRTNQIINKLKPFHLTLEAVDKIYFSDKEYIAQIDNLIYVIKEVWKAYNNIYPTKKDVLKKFINEFSCQDPLKLESDFANEIISVNKTFANSIRFFMVSYICFSDTLFNELCFNLEQMF